MAWVKKNCFVVTAFYRDELCQENEEEVFLLESEAEKCKAEFEADTDFGEVYIQEEKREIWVEAEKKKEGKQNQNFLGR